MTDSSGLTDMAAIRHFFYPDSPIKEFSPQYKALSDDEKAQLAEGIRNGTLTY